MPFNAHRRHVAAADRCHTRTVRMTGRRPSYSTTLCLVASSTAARRQIFRAALTNAPRSLRRRDCTAIWHRASPRQPRRLLGTRPAMPRFTAFAQIVAVPIVPRSHVAALSSPQTHEPASKRRRPNSPRAAVSSLPPIAHDAAVTVATIGLASSILSLLQFATPRFIPSTLTRKLVHIFCAPAAVCCWAFYSDAPTARIVAAVVPLVFAARILFSKSLSSSSTSSLAPSASGKQKPAFTTLADALSRNYASPAPQIEATQGPLIYVIFLAAASIFLWRSTPAAVAVAQLAFGDGFADILGRNFGAGTEWRFARAGSKTIVGSTAFIAAALAGSASLLAWLHASGVLVTPDWSLATRLPTLALISTACAAVELLLPEIDDNLSIPAVAILLALWLHA
jgi:dolichol kinase